MWYANKPNGTFVQERVTDPLTGKSRIVSVKVIKDTAAGRKQAEKDLAEKINKSKPDKKKLSDIMKLYFADQEKTVRASTLRRNMSLIESVVSITGDIYMSKLTAGYVRSKLIESGKSSETCNEYIKRFKAMIRWAYDNDLIPDKTVADKLKLFKVDKEEDARYFEGDQFRKLVNGIDDPFYKEVTRFLGLSGLRIGEFVALDDTDIAAGYIKVYKTFDPVEKKIGPTKTTDSVRDVFIQPELDECIRKLRLMMKERRLKIGKNVPYFVFSNRGERLNYATYQKFLKKKAKEILDIDCDGPHWLRHTMTSLFAEAGIPLETISRRLGHADSSITRKIYLHTTEKMKDRDDEMVSKIRIMT